MQVKLIQIGNSKGLRLPKNLIKQFNLDSNTIELIVESDGIKIKPTSAIPALETWDLLFKNAIANDEQPDNDVFEGTQNSADEFEWTW